MSEIDPVILELRAELGKYRADLKSTTAMVTQLLGKQERDVQRLEKQMLKSSSAISGALRTIGGSLGTYFSGREIVGLIDNFTRLQNSLRVAGLEGADLNRVQTELLALSAKYGVSVNELADLFGKATQAGSDLGASQAQLLQITEASAQSLKITGTSAVQAQGALLGLTQALASGVVRAEEFNQINEGGLRPLLQLAANAERFGGSVAKLRQAVVDGKFSSEEFFNAILKGSDELEGKASKATLTLAGAFAALTSALTVYVGQSAEANGVTEALTGAMHLLAENLDTIIPALSVIATIFAGRFLAGALAGGAAMQSLAAYASIATTSLAGTALAARGAGAALLAAFGGPVGLAITALILSLGAVAYATRDTAASLADLEGALATAEGRLDDARAQAKAAGINIENLSSATDTASGSFSKFTSIVWAGVDAMTSAAKAAKDLTLAKIALSSAEARSTIAELSPLARKQASGVRFAKDAPGFSGGVSAQQVATLNETSARLDLAAATLRANEETVKIIKALGPSFKEPGGGASSAGAAGKPKKTPKGRTRAAEDVEAKLFRASQDELSAQLEVLRAKSQLALEAGARGEAERDAMNIEAQIRENEIAEALRKKDITKEQAEAQRAILDQLYGEISGFDEETGIATRGRQSLYGLAIAREERLQAERDRADVAEAEYRAEADALRNQFDLATTDDDRRTIALRILDAEDAYLRSKLEAVVANEDLAAAVREQAQIELNALNASAGDRRKLVEKANQGALGRYIDSIGDTKARAEEAIARELQAVNDGITDALTESLGVKNQFVKDMFSLFLDQVIFRPLAELLRGGQGGGGGFFGSLISSIFGAGTAAATGGASVGNSFLSGALSGVFGRTSGGYNAPHSIKRVNEHAGGVELLRMGSQGGTVIPLGQVNGRAASSAPNITVISSPQFDLRGAVMTPKLYADMERISQANAARAASAAYDRSMKDAPAAVASAQRYGPR